METVKRIIFNHYGLKPVIVDNYEKGDMAQFLATDVYPMCGVRGIYEVVMTKGILDCWGIVQRSELIDVVCELSPMEFKARGLNIEPTVRAIRTTLHMDDLRFPNKLLKALREFA